MTESTDTPQSPLATHVDASGQVRMVDVSAKEVTRRTAVAEAWVQMSPAALKALDHGTNVKGPVLETARLAGVMAAKQTSGLIPLCHPVPLEHVAVDFQIAPPDRLRVTVSVSAEAKTGVEMEALSAAAVAALTVYDMLKAVDRGMVLGPIQLLEKSGGRSGRYLRESDTDGPR